MFGFGKNKKDLTNKELVVVARRCPQNHKCPAVSVCPVDALSQKGNSAPKVNLKKCIKCGKCTKYCVWRAIRFQDKKEA